MLPTEKASLICLNTNEQLYLSKEMNMADDNNEYQHLYIISDDEIKEGDWVIHYVNQAPKLVENKMQAVLYTESLEKKIVATTDKSLNECLICKNTSSSDFNDHDHINMPQIPESFIQAYIKAYNEGKPITEVDLEMEIDYVANATPPTKPMDPTVYKIKTRPDNTVIVHQSKMYSRDEVEYLIKCATDEILHVLGYDTGKKMKETGVMSHINKWIQDNL